MARTANVSVQYTESHPIGSGIYTLLTEMLKSYKPMEKHSIVSVEVVETYIENDDTESPRINATQITWDDSQGSPYSKVAVLVFEADRTAQYREPKFVVRYADSVFSHDEPRTSDIHYYVKSMGNALVEICNVFLNTHPMIPRSRKFPQ